MSVSFHFARFNFEHIQTRTETSACAASYLFADEGAGQGDKRPEDDAAAQDDLSVEAVAQVTEDGSCHHEAADEDCGRKRGESVTGAGRQRWRGHVLLLLQRLCFYESFRIHTWSQELPRMTGWYQSARNPVKGCQGTFLLQKSTSNYLPIIAHLHLIKDPWQRKFNTDNTAWAQFMQCMGERDGSKIVSVQSEVNPYRPIHSITESVPGLLGEDCDVHE